MGCEKIESIVKPEFCQYLNLREVVEMPTIEEEYEYIIVAGSIRYGNLAKEIYQFINKNVNFLQEQNSVFICVNLTARKESEGKDRADGNRYVEKFLQRSAWQPKQIKVFAGALRYPLYSWFDKMMIKLIMKLTGGETDTTKEVEYTNW